jgi:hypothetical protein
MASFQDRVIGALKLQASTFEEVENDPAATTQAATVVAAVALARALGGIIYGSITVFLLTIVFAFIGWIVGSAVLYIVGTRVMPGKNTKADLQQMMRVAGFAQAPGIFGILAIIPFLGLLIGLAVAIWGLVALVIGVKAALDYEDIVQAIIVCVIAWVAMWLVMMVLAFASFGAGARWF